MNIGFGGPFGGGFDLMFNIFPFLFTAVFIIVIVVIASSAVKGLRQYHRNNESPVLTVDARMVTKRTNVTHHHHNHAGDATGMHGGYTTSSTTYYATFEVESGDRLEFEVAATEYGILVEGDAGKLTFQGTRYKGFQRART